LRFGDIDLEALRRRRSEKWRAYPPDVLPAHIAEMDFELAVPIQEALVEAVRAGDVGYAHPRGSGLAEAFAAFARGRWRWDVDPDAIVAVPDVMVGVAELLRILTPEGAGVVINTPVYYPFFSVIAEIGRRVVEVPLREDGLPLDGIRDALGAGARAVLLCNPHNPTGYVAHAEELRELGALVAEHDAVLLSDEVHAALTFPGVKHVPICSVVEHAIALTSATKPWNLAGLKCGLAIAPSRRGALESLPVDLPDRIGHLGVIASTVAFTSGGDWLDALREYLAETHRDLPGLLAEHAPGVRVASARATFLAWLDFRETEIADDPAGAALGRGRVALYQGTRFGSVGKGFARLNIGTSHALVEESIRRIGRALGV
jgi:cysteine-S-conjugate beta-lyase